MLLRARQGSYLEGHLVQVECLEPSAIHDAILLAESGQQSVRSREANARMDVERELTKPIPKVIISTAMLTVVELIALIMLKSVKSATRKFTLRDRYDFAC
jgi:hypothetical protein